MKKYLNLIGRIRTASDNYYNGEPTITDKEFDNLVIEAAVLEELTGFIDPRSPSVCVGAPPKSKDKYRHLEPMLSIQNNPSISTWVNSLGIPGIDHTTVSFLCEPKLDGVAINLIYINGVLHKAVTRGDGVYGNIISKDNIALVHGVPLSIGENKPIEVRGELVIHKSDFETENRKLSNTRNSIIGVLGGLDKSKVRDRKIRFYLHSVGRNQLNKKSLWSTLDYLAVCYGFNRSPLVKVVSGVTEAKGYYDELVSTRDELDIEIDGAVIKIDTLSVSNKLPNRHTSHRWQIAVKMPSVEMVTKLIGVNMQVGSDGSITPVGILEPVKFHTSMVSRVTLHNYKMVTALGLHLGDDVVITLSGDVIPKLVRIDENNTRHQAVAVNPPSRCPECDSSLSVTRTGVSCINPECDAKLIAKMRSYAGRNRANITGLGSKIATLLVKSGIARHPKDLYMLKTEDLVKLDGVGIKIAEKLIRNIRGTVGMSLPTFIHSMGVPNLGKRASNKIAPHFNIKDMPETSYTLGDISGLSNIITRGFDDNKDYIVEMYHILNPQPHV